MEMTQRFELKIANDDFLIKSPDVNDDESNMNSISFKESLRFFQDQLLNTTNSSSCGKINHQGSSLPLPSESLDSLDMTKDNIFSYSSSKIQPIPTVETILESVKILRAIQKSQAQKGSEWDDNMSLSNNAGSLDTYNELHEKLHKQLNDVENSERIKLKGTGLNTQAKHISKFKHLDNSEAFWPTNFNDLSSQNHDIHANSPEEKNISGEIHYKEMDSHMCITDTFLFKTDSANIKKLESLTNKSNGSNTEEDGINDFIPCSSLELGISQRSTSTELDSGMGTDKSVGSLSPLRCEMDREKDLWSESSHYASAEGSPCESLIGIIEDTILSPTNGLCNSTAGKHEKDSAASELDQDAQDERKSFINNNSEISQKKDDDVCNVPGVSFLSILATNNDQDKVTSNNITTDTPSEVLKEDDHVSKDRLVEVIEDKIEQVKLNMTNENSKISDDSVAETDNNLEDPVLITDDSTNEQDNNVLFEDIIVKPKIEHENADPQMPSASLDQEYSQPKILQLHDSLKELFDTTNGSPYSLGIQDSPCVSLLESPSGSEISVDTLASEDTLEDDEPHRPKKKLTVSWDPIPLLEHLYHMPDISAQKLTTDANKVTEEFLNFEPVGIFENCKSPVYVVLDGNILYCYESDTKGTLLQEMPLQYAKTEVINEKCLLIDNRMGRWMKAIFKNENDMLMWKALFESHCKLSHQEKRVEPVHFPLKFHKNIVIIDLGSCSTRAGILMDQPTLPTLFFPTVCATDKKTYGQTFGVDALLPDIRKRSSLSFPVRSSAKVTKFTMDIDALSGLFKTVFSNLKIDPKNYTIQLCIPRSLSTNTQIALVKLLLEDFSAQAISLTRQALLTLYAHKTSTAIVVDIGDRMEVLPVADGFILESGVSRLPYGGQRIIHHMKHALAQKHISLSNDVESFVVQYIFESLCYISRNYDEELSMAVTQPNAIRKSVSLSPFFKDNSKIQSVTLDVGRFQVPEGLFKPDLWGLDSAGLHKLIHQAIQSSGVDVRRKMAENIFVSGGITLLPGFVERLQAEIAKLTLPRLMPKVHASPYRYHMTYLGACELASSDAFPQVCITAKEWMVKGPSALNRWHL